MTMLLLFSTSSFILSVAAESEDDSTLEARGIEAHMNGNETVTITWRNIQTDNIFLLTNLTQSNYSLYRSTGVINSSNINFLQPVATLIPACTTTTLFGCRGLVHEITLSITPGEDNWFYYAVVTTLGNGSQTTTLHPNNSSLASPVHEMAHEVWAPLHLEASYNVESMETTLTWINLNDFGANLPQVGNDSYRVHVWRHLELADEEGLGGSEQLVANLSAMDGVKARSSYTTKSLNNSREENAYYSVTYAFPDYEDTRLFGSNTLKNPVWEDNVAPPAVLNLSVTHNDSVDITTMSWEVNTNETNLTAVIWRAPQSFNSTSDIGVGIITNISDNVSLLNWSVPAGTFGDFHYAVTLSDRIGNHRQLLTPAEIKGPFHEDTLANSDIQPTSVAAERVDNTKTKVTWYDVVDYPEATYHIWQSFTGVITEQQITDAKATKVATVVAGVQQVKIAVPDEVERDAWYAVTAEAVWDESTSASEMQIFTSGINAAPTSIREDTLAPLQPTLGLAVAGSADGTVTLSWLPATNETGERYEVWRHPTDGADVSNISSDPSALGWLHIATVLDNAATVQYTQVITLGARTDETAVYAVRVADSYDNMLPSINLQKTLTVNEDTLPPIALMNVQKSGGGTVATVQVGHGSLLVPGLTTGSYILSFQVDESLANLRYRDRIKTIWTDAVGEGVNWAVNGLALSAEEGKVAIYDFEMIDTNGNSALFDIRFEVENDSTLTGDDSKGDNKQETTDLGQSSEGGSTLFTSGVLIMAVIIMALLLLLLKLNREGDSVQTPSGLPSKEEDSWYDGYIQDES